MAPARGFHARFGLGLLISLFLALPSHIQAQGGGSGNQTVQSNIEDVVQALESMAANGTPLTTDDENALRSMLERAEALRQSDVDRATAMAEVLVEFLNRQSGKDAEQFERFRIFEFRGLRILGEVAEEREQDDAAAVHYKRILDIALEVTGPGSDVTASWRAAFDRARSQPATRLAADAFDLTLNGDHGAARSLYEDAYARRVETLGAAHPDTLETLRSIAKTHGTEGNPAPATRIMSDVLAEQDQAAPSRVSDLIALSGYQDQAGRYEAAGTSLREAVEIAQNALPKAHNLRLIAVNDLAINLFKRGEVRDAADALRTALDLRLETQGPDHPETLTTMGNLGTVLSDLGLFAEAETLLREAYETSDELFGPDIPDTLTRASNLAQHLADRGRYQEAEAMYKDIIKRRRVQSGPTHPDTLISMNNVANVLVQTGRAWEAEGAFRQILSLREQALGPRHPDTLVSLNNLASTLRKLGRTETAEAEFERVLQARQTLFGAGHPDVLGVMITLATLKQDHGRMAEAEAMLRQAYDAARDRLGAAHPLTLTSGNNLAKLLTDAGQLEEALPLMRRVFEAREAQLGTDHPSTLGAAVNLASLYRARADYAPAVELLEQTVTRMEDTLGPDHLDVLTARNNLAISYLEMGNPEPALGHARAAVASRVPDALAGLPLSEPRAQAARRAVRLRGRALANITWAAAQQVSSGSSSAGADLLAEGFLAVQTSRSAAADALSRSAGRIAVAKRGLEDVMAARAQAQSNLTSLDEREAETARDADLDTQARASIRAEIAARRIAALGVIDAMDARLRREAPEFFSLVSPVPVSLTELQGGAADDPLLSDNEALILITPPERGFSGLVWAISRDQAAWSALSMTEAELRTGISRLHEMLDSPGETRGTFSLTDEEAKRVDGFDRGHAHALYQDLLGDARIQAVLDGKDTWIIAPQGMLLSLPFATLVSETPTGGSVADADPDALRNTAWLGLERAIAVVPEVASLRAARSGEPRRAPTRDFFGVGDPIYAQAVGASDEGQVIDAVFEGAIASPGDIGLLSPLPGTRAEIEAFATYFSAADDAVLLGASAREAGLAQAANAGALSEARIVVLATHGLVAGAFDGLAEPALAFSPPPCGPDTVGQMNARSTASDCPPSDPDRWAKLQKALSEGAWIDDGLLTATEAARLNLQAEWVILSACDTAAGDSQSPDAEGLSGLAQAFFHAGAQSLLVSHWPVRDDVAARLTTQAVAGADRGLTRPEALREAMRALVMDASADDTGRSFAHPAAWAAFQVTGH